MVSKVPLQLLELIEFVKTQNGLAFLSGTSAYEFLLKDEITAPVQLKVFSGSFVEIKEFVTNSLHKEISESENEINFVSDGKIVLIENIPLFKGIPDGDEFINFITLNEEILFTNKLTPETLLIKINGNDYEAYDHFGFLQNRETCTIAMTIQITALRFTEPSD